MNPQEEYNKTHYLYTPLFCEENIWQLLQSFFSKKVSTNTSQRVATDSTINMSKMWALIITNQNQKIALMNQQAAARNQPIIWDYHVILLAEIEQQYVIFDFDTHLPFATPLHEYLHNTFFPLDKLPPEFLPYVRKIPAQSYLERFHSDRTHMQNQIEKSKFPSWPIINIGKKHCITLGEYLNIEQALDDKSQTFKVFSLAALEQWLTTS